jgi:predicted metalloenzyme YecM
MTSIFIRIPTDVSLTIVFSWMEVRSVMALDSALCCKAERQNFLEMLRQVGCKLTNPCGLSINKWIRLRGITMSNLLIVEKSVNLLLGMNKVEKWHHVETLTIHSEKGLEFDTSHETVISYYINSEWANVRHITMKIHPSTMKKLLFDMYEERLAHLLSLELHWGNAAHPGIDTGVTKAADYCKELTSLKLISKFSFVEATTLGRFVNTNRGLVALEVTIERLSDEIIAVFSEGKCLKHVSLQIQQGFNLKSLRMFLEACPNLTSFSAMLHHCDGHHEQFNLDMFTNTCSNFVCEVHLKFLGPARYANGIVHTTFNHAQNGDAEVSNVLLSA